jgi:hypothetical protein
MMIINRIAMLQMRDEEVVDADPYSAETGETTDGMGETESKIFYYLS